MPAPAAAPPSNGADMMGLGGLMGGPPASNGLDAMAFGGAPSVAAAPPPLDQVNVTLQTVQPGDFPPVTMSVLLVLAFVIGVCRMLMHLYPLALMQVREEQPQGTTLLRQKLATSPNLRRCLLFYELWADACRQPQLSGCSAETNRGEAVASDRHDTANTQPNARATSGDATYAHPESDKGRPAPQVINEFSRHLTLL